MISKKRQIRLQILFTILCTGIVVIGVTLLYKFGLIMWADNYIYDYYVHKRGPLPTSDKVVLVLMDKKSAKKLNRLKGSWSRRQMAIALRNLCDADARIIGIDMIFNYPDCDSQADQILADTILDCNNVVLARGALSRGGEALSLDIFQDGMIGDGFIDFQPDKDDILRKIRFLNAKPLGDGTMQLLPAFSLELARAFLNIDFEFDFSNPDYFIMGAKGEKRLRLPYPELLINFHGRYTAFTNISYSDVVENRFPKEMVKGKIVIIGTSLTIDKDEYNTPFSRFFDTTSFFKKKFKKINKDILGERDLGVACHAHAVETILSQNFIKRVSESAPESNHIVIVFIILFGLAGLLFYTPMISLFWEMLILGAAICAVYQGSYSLFSTKLVLLDIAPLFCVLTLQFVFGIALQKYFSKKKAAQVTNLFSKYVSPGVVADLIKGDIETTLEGRSQELTILFSDLRDFSRLSEGLGAKNTSRLLNIYFDAMIPIVFKYQGTLDKLMGDAVMAFFGAPAQVPNHPVKAVETALKMLEEINNLRLRDDIEGIDKIDAGFGLNTDIVTVGNLGSHAFMDFTIVGDGVNLASRLEGLNKVYGTHIIISEFTAANLDERFLMRELDIVKVKGKEKAVVIFELIGFRNKLDECRVEMVKIFESGLDGFRNKKWDLAKKKFKTALQLIPEDRPSQLYLNRIEEFKQRPPEDDWIGVTKFNHK